MGVPITFHVLINSFRGWINRKCILSVSLHFDEKINSFAFHIDLRTVKVGCIVENLSNGYVLKCQQKLLKAHEKYSIRIFSVNEQMLFLFFRNQFLGLLFNEFIFNLCFTPRITKLYYFNLFVF